MTGPDSPGEKRTLEYRTPGWGIQLVGGEQGRDFSVHEIRIPIDFQSLSMFLKCSFTPHSSLTLEQKGLDSPTRDLFIYVQRTLQ